MWCEDFSFWNSLYPQCVPPFLHQGHASGRVLSRREGHGCPLIEPSHPPEPSAKESRDRLHSAVRLSEAGDIAVLKRQPRLACEGCVEYMASTNKKTIKSFCSLQSSWLPLSLSGLIHKLRASNSGMVRPPFIPSKGSWCPASHLPLTWESHTSFRCLRSLQLYGPFSGSPLETLLDTDRILQHHLMALHPWSLCKGPLSYQYLPHGLQALHKKKQSYCAQHTFRAKFLTSC